MPLLLDQQVKKAAWSVFTDSVAFMGQSFEISVVSENEEWAQRRISEAADEISRINRLLNSDNDESRICRINEMAGIAPVKVDAEIFYLIERSLRISQITRGAFDISYDSVPHSILNDHAGKKIQPAPASAKKVSGRISYRKIMLDKDEATVFLSEKGMRIGFEGMARGYAADRAKIILQENGVESCLINAGGNLSAWGNHPDGKPWTIGKANPDSMAYPFSWINISNAAVASSGNQHKLSLNGWKNNTSRFNPENGLKDECIKTATIICPQAEIADALANAVLVIGIQAGLDLLNQSPHITAILISDQDEIYTTENIRLI